MTCARCGKPMTHDYGFVWRCEDCGTTAVPRAERAKASVLLRAPMAFNEFRARPHATGRLRYPEMAR